MAERSSELENREGDELETVSTGDTALETRTTDAYDTRDETGDDAPETEAGEDTAEADQIREQIVETRRGMSETIDAIQEKLSFANISEQVQTQVSEQISGAVESAKDAILDKTAGIVNTVGRGFKDLGDTELGKKAQQNPTALALIGAGVGALLVGVFVGDKKKRKNKKSNSKRYESGGMKYDYNYGYDDYGSSGDDQVHYADTSRRELKSSAAVETSRTAVAPRQPAVPTSSAPKSTGETTGSKESGAASSAYKAVSDSASAALTSVGGAASAAYEAVGGAASKTYGSASDLAGKTVEGAGNLASKTYEAVGSAAGYTYEKAGDLGGQMKTNYNHYIEENPLAVGVVALAVGAAVGLAIPLTKKENEYLGEYRDQVFEKAQATVQETIGSVKQMATEAQKVITEEVKSKTA